MAAQPKTKPKTPRELAQELVGLHVKHRDVFERIDELKELLKAAATASGASIREVFDGQGKVSASGAKTGKFKGDLPTVDEVKFKALTEKQRADLLERGVIVIVPTYGSDYYGQVTVKLF